MSAEAMKDPQIQQLFLEQLGRRCPNRAGMCFPKGAYAGGYYGELTTAVGSWSEALELDEAIRANQVLLTKAKTRYEEIALCEVHCRQLVNRLGGKLAGPVAVEEFPVGRVNGILVQKVSEKDCFHCAIKQKSAIIRVRNKRSAFPKLVLALVFLAILFLSGCTSTRHINTHKDMEYRKICDPEKFTQEEKDFLKKNKPSIGKRIQRNKNSCEAKQSTLLKDIKTHNESHNKERKM